MNQPTLSHLIALGEGFTTEFKRSMPSDLGREICAFANATGGVILIGVDDAGTVIGVRDHNRLKSRVQSVARSADPPVAVEVESQGSVLCVTVPEQHGKPYSYGGRFYVREGATCQQMSRDEIRDFFFEEGLIRMDETPCSAFDPSVEITSARWTEFAERAGIDPGLPPMTVLENLHLVKDTGMTHAGAWLLADDITRFTLQAGVTCAGFRGSAKAHILDRKAFHGNLYAIYQEVMTYFQAKLNSALIPHAQGRDERLELPESALREAVVNAIAHRVSQHRQRAGLHLPRPGGDRGTRRTSRRNAGGGLGQQERPPKPFTLQYALPYEVSRADRQRRPPNSRRLSGARRCGASHSGLHRLGDSDLPASRSGYCPTCNPS